MYASYFRACQVCQEQALTQVLIQRMTLAFLDAPLSLYGRHRVPVNTSLSSFFSHCQELRLVNSSCTDRTMILIIRHLPRQGSTLLTGHSLASTDAEWKTEFYSLLGYKHGVNCCCSHSTRLHIETIVEREDHSMYYTQMWMLLCKEIHIIVRFFAVMHHIITNRQKPYTNKLLATSYYWWDIIIFFNVFRLVGRCPTHLCTNASFLTMQNSSFLIYQCAAADSQK